MASETELMTEFNHARHEGIGKIVKAQSTVDATIMFVSHDQQILDKAPETLANFQIRKVNLNDLELGHLQDNRLGEGRALIPTWREIKSEYIGFLNARLYHKYIYIPLNWQRVIDGINNLKRNHVLAPWPGQVRWAEFSELMHKGITPLLKELSDVAGMPLETGRRVLWANDFVCHQDIFFDFGTFWRKCFSHFHKKYGFDLPFPTYNVDAARKPAYFYERLACIYFANRFDLTIIPM